MVRVITVDDLRKLLHTVSLKTFMLKLIEQLKKDFARWDEFDKSPRHAIHVPEGVIEVMPIADKEFYTFKYVNGHPNNPKQKKQTVIATGQLSLVATGLPLLISEMTILTAIRTASTSALASSFLAKKNAKTFGIIGTGAQSEFQVLAHHFLLGIDEIYYFDIDQEAMKKFEHNLKPFSLKLHPCSDGKSVATHSDILTTATAQKGHRKVVEASFVKKGAHINGIGGDSPGKTEIDPQLLSQCKIVIEQLEQTSVEGEIQQIGKDKIYAELWELASGVKKGREKEDEFTLFDSVGFALEDYSTLRLLYDLAKQTKIGHELNMIPETEDPKDLFGVIQ